VLEQAVYVGGRLHAHARHEAPHRPVKGERSERRRVC
jgi:hypothetical protein